MTGPGRAWSPHYWPAYRDFHERAVTSGDIDPAYPVLARVCHHAGFSLARTVWTVALYVAYYDLGSGLSAAWRMARPTAPEAATLRLPCGVERRAHRHPPKLADHLTALRDYAAAHDGIHKGLTKAISGARAPGEAWTRLCNELATIHGNGRWAAYKTAEVLQHVAGLPVAAPDMGHAHSTGPRKGLALLHPAPTGNTARDVARLDRLSSDLVAALDDDGAPGATPAEVETTLCDFHSAIRGRYYTGHDIDKMAPQLSRADNNPLTQAAWTARREVFPHAYLGEYGGWTGVDKTLCRSWTERGVTGDRAHTP